MGTVFNAFWYGPPLNVFHWACMRSFLRRGHEYRLHVYDPVAAPEGVTLVDASELLPREQIFHFENPFTRKVDIGPFSDLFRYKLLLTLGGWYVDVDTFCMSHDIPDGIRAWAQENEKVINGAQMCLPKGDPLARKLYEECLAVSRNRALREDWGPNLLTRVIPSLGLPMSAFGSTSTFYPVDWISAFTLMLPSYSDEIRTKVGSALFLAAYQSFFQYCQIDLARTPPAGSCLRELYETLAPDQMTSTTYSTDEIISLVRTFLKNNRDWAIQLLVGSLGTRILDDLACNELALTLEETRDPEVEWRTKQKNESFVGFTPAILEAVPLFVRVGQPGGEVETLRLEPMDLQSGPRPLVSCVMVSRGNLQIAQHSVECYLRQDYPNRELIVVSASPDPEFEEFLRALEPARVRLIKVPGEFSLGELRNFSVAHSTGEIVCTWDDDDLFDPHRLSLGVHALIAANAGATFLIQLLMWYPSRKLLGISERRVWEGSMLAWRHVMPIYPALFRSEDSFVTNRIRARYPIVVLDEPYLYCRTITGRNTWDDSHFQKHFRRSQHLYGDQSYDQAIRVLAERTPILEYAATLEAIHR